MPARTARQWAAKTGTPMLKELGARIRERRIASGLSAGDAAARVGNYSSRNWYNWENGERAMAVQQLLDIAAVLNTSVAALTADLTIPAANPMDQRQQQASVALLRDYWALPERERLAVKRVLKQLRRREQKNFTRV